MKKKVAKKAVKSAKNNKTTKVKKLSKSQLKKAMGGAPMGFIANCHTHEK